MFPYLLTLLIFISDERRCSTYFFFIQVSPHYSAHASASLAEGSRVDCIQTCSSRVHCTSVSTGLHLLTSSTSFVKSRCRGSSATSFQFTFVTDCQPHPTVPTIGDRAFPVAAARVWNSLPDHVTSAPSVAVFRSRLETHLFNISYPSPL